MKIKINCVYLIWDTFDNIFTISEKLNYNSYLKNNFL